MKRHATSRQISAPVEVVFKAITDIEKFADRSPSIVSTEILTDQKEGVGTRFRETRRMGQRDGASELECAEYVENERVRFIADEGGAVWDSLYTITPEGDGVLLTLTLDARPHKIFAKFMTPMMMSAVSNALEKDMDAIKVFCETKPGDGSESLSEQEYASAKRILDWSCGCD